MHGCLMPSLFSQGQLLILAATHKLCQDFGKNNTKKNIRQCRELLVGAKKLRRMQAGGGTVSSLQLWIRPKLA
jgi:hypothetical protein